MNRPTLGVLAWFFSIGVSAADQLAPPPSPGANVTPKSSFDLTDPARIAAGKTRFNASCNFFCHGNEGSAGKTPAFKGRTDFTAESLFRVITEGVKPEMPDYENMSEERRWEVVAYILHLGRQKPGR
ncbi:MAG: cytochrome c [Betaproteobacteria bacterium]|nr:cytochrome c [Betaproteobacteria bacterium]